MRKKRKTYIKNCEVSYVKTAVLGGYSQKYAVEGRKKSLPVVICLHGGPGSPIPFSVGCRGLFPEFTDKFIMVYWDQLGCGVNNFRIDDNFSVKSFVDMTVDLIKEIKKDFRDNKLFLFGMSWGSILTLYATEQMSDIIDGVLVCGQVLYAPMISADAFQTLENSSAPEKAKEFAKNFRQQIEAHKEIDYRDAFRLSKFIRKYTNGYNGKSADSAPVAKLLKGMISSPDYRLKDFIAVVINGYRRNQSLVKEMRQIDLRGVLKNISCPYWIFQGETDIVTSTKELVTFVNGCGNKNIQYRVISDMGHFLTQNAMEQICDCLSGSLTAIM